MNHLENGHCQKISAQQFAGHLQHKNIVNKLLKDPELLRNITSNAGFLDAARDDDIGGGVSLGGGLLEQDANEQDGVLLDIAPLETEKHPDATNPPRLGESRLALKKRHENEVEQDIDALLCTGGTPPSSSVLAGTVDWSKIRGSTNGSMPPSTRSNLGFTGSITSEESDTTQKASTATAWGRPGASTSTSEVLFPGVKPTPVSYEWAQELQKRDQAYELEHGVNLFRSRFWDPTSRDYKPERFFNPITEMYMCSFPHCV
jgi:hypothetical protein